MTEQDARRPIAARNTGWSKRVASFLSRSGITPNQISVASMVFAAIAGGLLFASANAEGLLRAGLLLGAAIACQMRLLCNLFDGMVAIEGGLASKDGPFWNEFPDRVADILILVGAGLACGFVALGWAAACMAVLTAYVRELGRAVNVPADYRGPMAKQHRMAALTLGIVVTVFEPFWGWDGQALQVALLVITLGAAVTSLRRAAMLVKRLKRGPPESESGFTP